MLNKYTKFARSVLSNFIGVAIDPSLNIALR